jgi:hypothetical protein
MEELIIAPSPILSMPFLLDEFKAPKTLRNKIVDPETSDLRNTHSSWENIRLEVAKLLKAVNIDSTEDQLINLQNLYAIVSQYSYRPKKQP